MHANNGATWANSYPDLVDRDAVDGSAPVAMHLTALRNRKGGRKSDRRHVYLFLVFELDTTAGGRDAVRQHAAAISDLLAAHGIRSVPVASGPSGGMHVWTACPAGLPPQVVARIAEAAQVLYPTVDRTPLINPAGGAVRPPGSPHRHGGHARLTEHTVDEAIAVLKQGAAPAAFLALLRDLEEQAQAPALWSGRRSALAGPQRVRHGSRTVPPSVAIRGPIVRPLTTDQQGVPKLDMPWRPLGAAAERLAQRRPGTAPGAHQAARHAVLRALAGAGWDYRQAREYAADPKLSPALEWLRTASTPAGGRAALAPAEAEERMMRSWWLAVQDAARMPRRPADTDPAAETLSDAAAAAADLLARMEASGPARWTRQSGPADRAVLTAIAWQMTAYGLTELTVSVRRIAVLAGCSKSTAALALHRISLDGWTETAKDADTAHGTARRIRLAQAHQCSADRHHMCAHYGSAAGKTPDHYGSDRSGTPRPPRGGAASLSRLEGLIAHQQAGVWHHYGHHTARTLDVIQTHPGLSPQEITQRTGYQPRTTARHLDQLTSARLIEITKGTAVRTDRSLYEAGADKRCATRPVELATVARVEQSVHAWWTREAAWWQLDRTARRQHGPRASADQTLIPGMDPYARAYPRHAAETPDRPGPADHQRAFAIEAQRIDAAQLAAEADQLARTGQLIDSARLGRQQHQAAA